MYYELIADFLIKKLKNSRKTVIPYHYLIVNFDMELTKENLGKLAHVLICREEVADVYSDATGFHIVLYSKAGLYKGVCK